MADEGTPDEVNIALARQAKRSQKFRWVEWSKAAFQRARSEKKYILLHGAAVWCHWCHVMEETTYLDPEIGRILSERFVTIRVDVDSRPDIEERYGEWGWPATVLFSPDAEEIGKFRGYLPPDELRPILVGIESQSLGEADDALEREPGRYSATEAALPWVAERVARDMDWYYDSEQGGWGVRQKAPLGANATFELMRGGAAATERAIFSLTKQAALIDPVWGGIYQYSTGGTWDRPHFEKLMTYQAPNLEAYARAYAATKNADMKRHAERIAGYVDRFLKRSDGAFYVSQDADVGTHDKTQRFIDGNVFYRKSDAERRALGAPWVDEHVYAYENGLMIAALVTWSEASGDAGWMRRARRAADVVLASHVDDRGSVKHDAEKSSSVRFLADAAGFGYALARLAEATGEARYRDAALKVAEHAVATLEDPKTGAYWANTVDPDAAGVFSRRRRPLRHNTLAARCFAAVARVTGDDSWRSRARKVLAAVATPAALDQQGRMVGDFLVALHESGVTTSSP